MKRWLRLPLFHLILALPLSGEMAGVIDAHTPNSATNFVHERSWVNPGEGE